ncbi:MAG: glycosyltransferase family 4 protein [Methanobacteriota archaeon]
MSDANRAAPSIALLASDAFVSRTGIGRYQTALIEELGGRINLHALVNEQWIGRMSGRPPPPTLRGVPTHRYGRIGTAVGTTPWIAAHAVRTRDLITWNLGVCLQLLSARLLPGGYVDRMGFDLVHGTANYLPRTYGRTARVITVHDAIPLTHPEGLPTMLIRGFVRASELRPEDHIVTDSETALRELSRSFDHPRERQHVIPLAIDHGVFRPAPPESPGPPYILSVGIIAQHKNLVRGLGAFERVAAHDRDLRWKIIGLKGWGWNEFRHALGSSPARGRVDLLGLVPDETLAAYYRGARALLFPSLVEGFGIPVLEALACGTPVAASSIPVLHELAGDAFVQFDPLDPSGIAEALQRATFDEATRQRLRHAGLERAARFTWPRAAEEHLRVYAAALETDVPSLLLPGL